MSYRGIGAALAVGALLLAGCGGSKVTTATSAPKSSNASSAQEATSAEQSPAQAEPQPTLDPTACTDITGANLNLAVANNAEDAQKAADVFAKYNPPADVQDAISHFVQTEGAQFDDPDYDKFNSAIDNWVKAVCPL
jgi:hypothetical protein